MQVDGRKPHIYSYPMSLISVTKYRYLYGLPVSEIGKTIIYFNAEGFGLE